MFPSGERISQPMYRPAILSNNIALSQTNEGDSAVFILSLFGYGRSLPRILDSVFFLIAYRCIWGSQSNLASTIIQSFRPA